LVGLEFYEAENKRGGGQSLKGALGCAYEEGPEKGQNQKQPDLGWKEGVEGGVVDQKIN
jgi:hypothetical protein